MSATELVAGVTTVYGPPSHSASPAPVATGAIPAAVVLGRWQDESASLALLRGPYEDVKLVIRSETLAVQAREAVRAAVALEAAEAPGRKREADAVTEAAIAAERARNRSGFRP